ncbi:hypothetical protein [Amycolatopsis speibonae]|uniref:Uncharacterized protein n=1 Tax=Amycolatopsis speibonae TaxID=1450224 RepID=A0ABV7P6I7_9PSEU
MASDLIANDDPVKVERARSLLRSAAKAVDAFEEAIRELVAMRAWVVLGYKDLCVMWEAENGFKCPTYAKVLAVETLAAEGMNTRTGHAVRVHGPDGHTAAHVADLVGLPKAKSNGPTGSSRHVIAIRRQLDAGVPAKDVGLSPHTAAANLHKFAKSRPKPRRIGKAPDEFVNEGFAIPRRDADAVAEVAREADVPKAAIYRQAVAEYLQRHNVSTHFGHAPNGATPEVGASR